ncbi:MAG: Flp pilus assembly protein CpaB [Pseudomonadota bacterium]
MRLLPIVVVAVAILLSGGVYFIIAPQFAPPPAVEAERVVEVIKPAPMVKILVAGRVLPAGTILKDADVAWQAWPEEAARPEYIVEGKSSKPFGDVIGAAVKRGIGAAEPVLASQVVPKGESGFLAAVLAPGTRAAAVRIDAVTGAGGFIIPGDWVDVVLTERGEVDYGDGRTATRQAVSTVLSDLRVLAIDQSVKDIKESKDGKEVEEKPKVGSTATLEVTPEQGEILSLAAQLGKLGLVLRSLAREGEEPKRRPFIRDIEVSPFLAELEAAIQENAKKKTAAEATKNAGANGVKIYRGTTAGGGKTSP